MAKKPKSTMTTIIGPNEEHEINKLYAELRSHSSAAIFAAIELGELLTEKKKELPPDKLLSWLLNNVKFDEETAANCIAVSPVGLKLPANLSQKQWLDIGLGLGRFEQAGQWWIGDWWAFGEHKYGDCEALIEAQDWNGPSWDVCRHAGQVCSAFEESGRRRPLLSFEHHRALIALKLKPELVDEFLVWCEAPLKEGAKKPRSVRELEEEIIKRHNNNLDDRVIRSLDEAIALHEAKPNKETSDDLKAEIILALTNQVTVSNKEGTRVTQLELEMLREKLIDEKLASPTDAVILLTQFIGPIRNLVERDEDFDFGLMVKETPDELIEDYVRNCNIVRKQIDTFLLEHLMILHTCH
jgi:hypothetical protein